MDWDDIARKLSAADEVMRTLRGVEFNRQMRAFDEMLSKLTSPPFLDSLERQARAMEATSRQIEKFVASVDLLDINRKIQQVLASVDTRTLEQFLLTLPVADTGHRSGLTNTRPDRPKRTLRHRIPSELRGSGPSPQVIAAESTPLGSGGSALSEWAAALVAVARDKSTSLLARADVLNFLLAIVFFLYQQAQDYRDAEIASQRHDEVVSAVREGNGVLRKILTELRAKNGRPPAQVIDVAPLRAERTRKGRRLMTLRVGQYINVRRHAGAWLFVEVAAADGATISGWVHSDHVSMPME